VEGPSETALINKLLDDERLNLTQGTYILDCLGKYNIHRFMSLLGWLGVNHSVLHDDDENKNEHQELNQLIADSKHSTCTMEIKHIPKDLEKALGVTPPGAPHRKPQHLIYCYATGQIDNTKLDDFCELVQSCFPIKPNVQG
jgi:putative ATP-dependent endonuclease of the OLD family